MVVDNFKPQALICQCGADGLAMDEMDSFNLSSDSYMECVRKVLSLRLPTLLLGGGEWFNIHVTSGSLSFRYKIKTSSSVGSITNE